MFCLLLTYLRPEGVVCSGVVVSEKTPLVIFGMAKVRRVRISALLSGLKLEADLENGQASATYRQKVRGGSFRCISTLSVNEIFRVSMEIDLYSEFTVLFIVIVCIISLI